MVDCFLQLTIDLVIDQPASVGSLLITALFDWEATPKDPFRCWFASMMLSQIIRRNLKAQEVALKLKFNEESEGLFLLSAEQCRFCRFLAAVSSFIAH